MSNNILDEYLVKLGFTTDTVSYARFSAGIKDAASLVDNQYLRMAKTVLGFQAAATGAFVAVGAAALTIADKTAMADQQYRLLALHMYTSLPVARELKIALDALGQPLENVMWDPELARRFHQLVEDQRSMTQQLGPDFETQMLKIRDVRFEFSRFGVELQYLTMYVVEDLAKAFGTNIDGLLEKMRNFNDYLIKNMPQIAQWITTKLKPVLIDVYNVMTQIGKTAIQVGQAFSQVNWINIIQDIGKAIIALMQLETNFILMMAAANEARKGNFGEAMKDLRAMQVVSGAPASTEAAIVPTGAGAGPSTATPSYVQSAIVSQAKALGLSPSLALAVAQVESSFRQFDKNGKVLVSDQPGSHATGIFQLQPLMAKALGVDPNDVGGNILGGEKLLKGLLEKYGNARSALEHYYGSTDSAENKAYADKVLGAQTTINITVNATTNADAQQIAKETWKIADQAMKNRTQRNLAEFNNPAWSY